MYLAIPILFLAWITHAELKEKSAFEQALEQNQSVSTKEQWVEYDGVRYREVLYQGRKFYLQFRSEESDAAQLTCDRLNSDSAQSHLVELGAAVFKRSRLFVEFLKVQCEDTAGGRARTAVVIDPRFGFTLPENEKSTLKNKKVFVRPGSPGLGFSGDW